MTHNYVKRIKQIIKGKSYLFRNYKFIISNKNNTQFNKRNFWRTQIKIDGNNNSIIIEDTSRLSNCEISLGKNCFNTIKVAEGCQLKNVCFIILGDYNTIIIDKKCILHDTTFWIEDRYGSIRIGAKTTIHGKTQLAVMEETAITIGEDCMFSSDIFFRTGDSHSIVDNNGNRINASESISVGNHCWIGTKVICLKGTIVGDNCVVGAGSILSGYYDESNCILAGVPARVKKKNINWLRERI